MFPGTEVTDSCEPPHGCWEAEPGSSLQEQRVILVFEPTLVAGIVFLLPSWLIW